MTQLIACRAIQGVGAGGLLPLAMTILGDLYTMKERARTQGYFSMVWGLASILGPLIGGYLTEVLSWRWVFYLNLPFGAVAAAFVGLALVDTHQHAEPRIDYPGAVLLMAAVGLLMLGLGQAGAPDAVLSAPQVAGVFASAAVVGALFLWSQGRAREPIIPLGLFRRRIVSTTTVTGFLTGLAMFGALGFVPLFVQHAQGGTASEAGKALSPLLLGWVGMSVVTSRLLPRIGHRPLILGGLSLVVVGFIGLASATHDTPSWKLHAELGAMGSGMGLTMLSLVLTVQNAVPRAQLGVATSVGQFSRSIGGAVGVSLLGAVVAASLPAAGTGDLRAMEAALHNAFVVAAIAAALALLAATRIPGHIDSNGVPPPTGKRATPAN
jgi:MFS family permease